MYKNCNFDFTWKLAICILIIVVLWNAKDIKKLEDKVEVLEAVPAQVEKTCADYTLKEFREGLAPGKCQAEVYGDQF